MRSKHYKIYLGISAVFVILLAMIAESVYFSDFEYKLRTRKFNKKLSEKETIIDDCINNLKLILDKGEDVNQAAKENPFSVMENQGTILYYLDKKLAHWSNNSFDVPLTYSDSLFSKPLVFIQNGWFITKKVKAGNGLIIALLRLRYDYGFENDLVKNGFVKDFGVPEKTGFSVEKNNSDFNIYSKDGKRIFSLVFPPGRIESYFIALPLACGQSPLSFFFFLFLKWYRF
jgi:hypothetical protein